MQLHTASLRLAIMALTVLLISKPQIRTTSLNAIRKRSVRICFIVYRVHDPRALIFVAHQIHGSVRKVLHEMRLRTQVTLYNDLGKFSFQCAVEEPKNLK